MSTLAPSIDVQVKSVLIATDFSSASERALGHATTVARLYQAKFYLLYVVPSVGPRAAGPEETNAATEAAWMDVQQVQSQLIESGAVAIYLTNSSFVKAMYGKRRRRLSTRSKSTC
jgi:nucleotide-binding universal stress UspA family protein